MRLSRNQVLFLEQELSLALGTRIQINRFSPVSGGSINETLMLESNEERFFVKFNNAQKYPKMFEAEVKGLELLKATQTVSIPTTIFNKEFEGTDFLVLEYIEESNKSDHFWLNFGSNLAKLHKNSNSHFGLDHSNYIGSLPQNNALHQNWFDYFIQERILPKVKEARDQQLLERGHSKRFDQAFKVWENGFFPEEVPALIHGDLWSGNFKCNKKGEATIFDPAVYYGHREMDLAMTHLFAGFTPAFYEAYGDTFPVEKHLNERIPVYNLYPLLVHLLLFGRSYQSQIEAIIRVF